MEWMNYDYRIKNISDEHIRTTFQFFENNIDKINDIINVILMVLKVGDKGKIFIFGNGGSAADAQHIAAEFVNKFLINRKSMPAIALTTDTSVITAIGNDIGYDQIFSRQLEAFGKFGDLAIGISTSGNSLNVLYGLKTAREMGLNTVAFLGCDGGKIHKRFPHDRHIIVPSYSTPRIQEVHITLAHVICEIVEDILFGEKNE